MPFPLKSLVSALGPTKAMHAAVRPVVASVSPLVVPRMKKPASVGRLATERLVSPGKARATQYQPWLLAGGREGAKKRSKTLGCGAWINRVAKAPLESLVSETTSSQRSLVV